MFMKLIKKIGLILLLLAMAYASNWDLPKETRDSWLEDNAEEIAEYEGSMECLPYVVINGEKYEGQYIDGMWYEPLEIYGGLIPDEFFMESENADL